MSQTNTICIFARAPVPGECKTRLAQTIGDTEAAKVQSRLTQLAVETAIMADLGTVELWCAPDTSHPFFSRCRRHFDIELHGQRGTGLGERMHNTLARKPGSIIIGTDCPALTRGHLKQAAAELQGGRDAVFFPAEDGGYVLVGTRRRQPGLFRGIEWGTATVMAATRKLASSLDLSTWEGETLWDVDNREDLDRARQAGFNV